MYDLDFARFKSKFSYEYSAPILSLICFVCLKRTYSHMFQLVWDILEKCSVVNSDTWILNPTVE